jgi:superfamily II DNA helicase RecQ
MKGNTKAICLIALRKILNDPRAAFKSPEQAMAAVAVYEGVSDVIIKLPTGGGKSLTFLIAASLETSFATIVIYPLVSLLQDQKDRFNNMGLTSTIWTSNCRAMECLGSLVLVHANQTTQDAFHAFIGVLTAERALKRIVIDEFHVVTQWSFSQAINQLKWITHRHNVPLVLLSGSFSKATLNQVLKDFNLKSPVMINASTVRTNLVIRVETCESVAAVAISDLKTCTQTFDVKDRGIVSVCL